MGLESGSFINSLVDTNPTGGDFPAQGDDHLKFIKKTILESLPGLDAPVSLIWQDSTGVGNDYETLMDPAPATLLDGMVVYFRADKTNTGTARLLVNALFADIYIGESPSQGNDIVGGGFYRCAFDAVGNVWQLVIESQVLNPRDVIQYTPVNDIGSPASTQDIDWTAHDFQTLIHDKNVTLTFTDPIGASTSLILLLKPDGGVGRTVTFPLNVKVTNGSYQVNSVAGAYDLIEFAFDGTNYYARMYEAMR